MPRRKLYKYNRTGTRLAVLILVTDRWALELGSQQVSQRAHSTGNGTSPRPVDYDEQRPQGSSHITLTLYAWNEANLPERDELSEDKIYA